ncbi:MAG TPA: TolC family protein [Steroidobacteraceae bacterium]|nr:TolC family protein [Steroidobacteraceae bacterium]
MAAGITVFAAALAGCASYAPDPLPEKPDSTGKAAAQMHERAPLDMDAVATLAVLNNPDINAARAQMQVAAAQAFAAGILPEPQMGATTDVPYDRVTSPRDPRYPEYHAYGFTLGVDVRALLTHASKRASADAAYRQAQQEMLWKEWQTIAEVRTLYVAQSIAEERRALLAPAAEQYALAAARSQRALARHDVTLEQSGADEAALAVIQTQLGGASRDALKAESSLRALLGLAPDEPVALRPLGPPAIPDRAQVAAAAERLPSSRPDLRALQEGYRSEEAQLRVAVLSQFPDVVVGFSRARDVSDVHTNGGIVSFNLPIFDGARGDIAVQKATRAGLRAEYQARLDQARADIWSLWDEIEQLRAELAELEARLPSLEQGASNSRRGFSAGIFPGASYFIAVNALLTAQSSRFDLLQTLWDDSIALATVTGTEVRPER